MQIGQVNGGNAFDQKDEIVMRRSVIVEGVTFQTDFFPDHISIQAKDDDGIKIDLNGTGVLGSLSIRCDGGKRFRYPLRPTSKGRLVATLGSRLDPDALFEMRVRLLGVINPNEVTVYEERGVIPGGSQIVNREAIQRQRFCPVSGRLLDPETQLHQAKHVDRVIFCCSEDCLVKLESIPAESLVDFSSVKVIKSSDEDDLLINLQLSCPVMEMRLGSMGQPIKVLVGRQPLFLCCKGCVKKVAANPLHFVDKALAKGGKALAKQLAVAIERDIDSQSPSSEADFEKLPEGVFPVRGFDEIHIASQKICPVMEEPLDAMGGPFKVNVEGKAIYICCPGCAKTLNQNPREYVGSLENQGVHLPSFR